MNEISDIYNSTEKKIDKLLDNHLRKLKASIRKLERKIIGKAASILDVNKFGDIQSQRTLKRAIEYHKSLINEFELEYGKMTRVITKEFSHIQAIVELEFKSLDIPISFTIADRDMFKALQASTLVGFAGLSEHVISKLTQATYDAVIVGQSFGKFVDVIKDQANVLDVHAKRQAHDSLMGYYTRLNVKKAVDADIETFLYYGDIIRSSRAFCIARVGKLFTIDEIRAWDGWRWKGKKPGSTLINRGGYNCRHSFHPCDPEWLEGDKIDVQNWYDENNDMSDSLKKEVKMEQNKL
jgi:hypothetical protein